jgi:hypothetical protein
MKTIFVKSYLFVSGVILDRVPSAGILLAYAIEASLLIVGVFVVNRHKNVME